MNDKELRIAIGRKYAQAAVAGRAGKSGCCEPSCCGAGEASADPGPWDLYSDLEKSRLPKGAVSASLGCGNPTALADLQPGETVLDLGSGGGIDVLLSAQQVGPTGKAYGLDMTDEMLSLARENLARSGLSNVEFLKGEIEHIPLPGDAVDVILSNCVINLSADKDQVFREAFRVLKPGGRLAVSDMVVVGEVPADFRKNLELWMGCLAGALDQEEYHAKLEKAGFSEVSLEATGVVGQVGARENTARAGSKTDPAPHPAGGTILSAFVRARKPR